MEKVVTAFDRVCIPADCVSRFRKLFTRIELRILRRPSSPTLVTKADLHAGLADLRAGLADLRADLYPPYGSRPAIVAGFLAIVQVIAGK